MEDIKEKAGKLMEECERHGFAATIAISDPDDLEEKGFLGSTGLLIANIANIAGILMNFEDQSGVPLKKMINDIQKGIKEYRRKY